MKDEKKAEASVGPLPVKQEHEEKSPYMSRGIYKNYSKGMKERNRKRKGQGLEALQVRTFEEWSNG